MPTDRPSPRDLYAEAQALRDQWLGKEEEAVRAALQEASGFVQRAAVILGVNDDTLYRLITAGRLKALGAEAKELRAASGYTFGKPKSA